MKKIILLLWIVAIFVSINVQAKMDVSHIAQFEGFSEKPYWDVKQNSIGYGTSVTRAKLHGYVAGTVTKEQAYKWLVKEVIKEEIFISSKIKNYKDLPMGIKRALVSASYNCRGLIGPKLVKYINTKNWRMAMIEISLGHNPKNKYGLVKRRFAEANLIAKSMGLPTLTTPKDMESFRALKDKVYR